MQYPLRMTSRLFGRPAMHACSMALAVCMLLSAANGVSSNEVAGERWPPLKRVPRLLDHPVRLPDVAPATWSQPSSPPAQPASALDGAPRYFDGLASEPDKVLAASAEMPVRLVSLARNLDSYQTNPEGPPAALPPEEPIGQAPPDTSQVFLRSVTVLLQPGQIQFDWGVEYMLQKATGPGLALVNGDVVVFEQELRDRRLLIPFAARLGVAPRVQAFVRAPIGWTQAEHASPFGEATDDTFNVADVNAGVNLLLRDGQGQRADLVGTIGVTAPTGKHPFEDQIAVASLGDGFWAVDASLLWIRSYDPVVVFWGVGYRHLFERDYLGVGIAPGKQVNYNLGIGFAINDRITLSSAFIGQYVTETEVDGTYLPGSDLEPMSLRMALTAITSPCHVVEPFVRFGLTDDATDVDFGVIITRSY